MIMISEMTPREEFETILQVLTVDEIEELKTRLYSGLVDGHKYIDETEVAGQCKTCLYGTLALMRSSQEFLMDAYFNRGEIEEEINGLLGVDNLGLWVTPLERFFTDVTMGDTPETNYRLQDIETWINEYLESK